jgi:hypothetical protein
MLTAAPGLEKPLLQASAGGPLPAYGFCVLTVLPQNWPYNAILRFLQNILLTCNHFSLLCNKHSRKNTQTQGRRQCGWWGRENHQEKEHTECFIICINMNTLCWKYMDSPLKTHSLNKNVLKYFLEACKANRRPTQISTSLFVPELWVFGWQISWFNLVPTCFVLGPPKFSSLLQNSKGPTPLLDDQ